LINFIIDALPVIGVLAAAVAAYNLVIHWAAIKTAAFAIITKGITLATTIWTGAQWLLNAALTMNPIGLVIAAIIALIAIIAYVAYTTEGWGKTWDNIMTWMKLGIELFKTSIEFQWLVIKEAFLTGFETIEKGWYKLQSLWNKDAANEGLAKLESQRNERLQEIAAAKNKIDDLNQQMAKMTVWEVKSNGKSLKDLTGSLKEKLGIGGIGTNDQLQGLVGGGGGAVELGGGNATNEAIATGGTRNSTVNIKFNDMVGSMIFQGGFSEKKGEFEREVTAIFARMLGMAETQLA